ncbi:ribonuclease H-like domain-containing protein [Dokdonella sp.]|uniref:ribonuclease H-like domain-containing protein n=1 Tax=Dokdonella sp. TaxID=2291710 RepID=UPI002F419011
MTIVDRLRALQRQAGRPGPRGEPDSDVRQALRRLIGARDRSAGLAREALAAPVGAQVANGLHLVEQRIPWDGPRDLALPGGSDPLHVHRERVACFDTETTGLAGGVGTKAFMIGLAQWRGDSLHVRQLYLSALAGESDMLRLFASWLAPDAILVSYNGRSYDAPLLKGRYRMHRHTHPFDALQHVDLLHPVRRAYRGQWSDCRLKTVERELLGIVRENDLPGSEAPAAWLAFLRGRSAHPLKRVAEHNRQDVVTLAALLEHFSRRHTEDDRALSA